LRNDTLSHVGDDTETYQRNAYQKDNKVIRLDGTYKDEEDHRRKAEKETRKGA